MQDEEAVLGVQGRIAITTRNKEILLDGIKTCPSTRVQGRVIASSGIVQGGEGLKVPFVAKQNFRAVGYSRKAPVVPATTVTKNVEVQNRSIYM